MFGFLKNKQKSGDQANTASPSPNSNTEDIKPPRRTSSEPMLMTLELDNTSGKKKRGASTRPSPAPRGRSSRDDFNESGGLENQTKEQLETYAINKAEETTSSVNNCLRIAENIREDATKTIDTLHQQGEQINRTHNMTVDIDKDLTKGDKLISGLGGIFSMPKMPKFVNHVKGPVSSPGDNPNTQKQANKEEREKLGLGPGNKGQKGSKSKTPPTEPTNALQKVEIEKQKQDDALSDLSDILGDLKGMAEGMGTELDRQNKALDHLSDDVDILNDRMKNTNHRAKKLLK